MKSEKQRAEALERAKELLGHYWDHYFGALTDGGVVLYESENSEDSNVCCACVVGSMVISQGFWSFEEQQAMREADQNMGIYNPYPKSLSDAIEKIRRSSLVRALEVAHDDAVFTVADILDDKFGYRNFNFQDEKHQFATFEQFYKNILNLLVDWNVSKEDIAELRKKWNRKLRDERRDYGHIASI